MSFTTRSSIARLPALAVLVSLAAFALLVLVGGTTAHATLSDGDVVLGAAPNNACTPGTDVNCASSLTGIGTTVSGGDAFHAFSASGDGLGGFSTSGGGVFGQSSSGTGIKGQTAGNSGFGVYGINTGTPGGVGIEGAGVIGVDGEGSGIGVIARGNGGGYGLAARASSGRAVEGISDSAEGVYGQSSTQDGVVGISSSGRAVYGQSGSGDGVNGVSFGTGKAGVKGDARSANSIGVAATNGGFAGATALKATGKTSFSRSGKLTVPAGSSSATKSPINLGSNSLVLATIQGNQAGVYVQGVTQVAGASGSFTIHLSKNTTATLPVAWFVVN
jgi:hypothetical protein